MAFKQKDVRVGHSLNDAETHYVNSRKEAVQDALQRLGVDCTQDEVPIIAVMSSGGEDLTGMLGLPFFLYGLQQAGLLDMITYLSGSSESTWGMASLYQEPNWSENLKNIIGTIIDRLIDRNVKFEMQYEKLKKYYQEKNFSLTHVWAVLLSGIVNQIDEHVLTEQRNKHDADPYPIFNVIDKQCADNKWYREAWFEITPDESGYSLRGAFVDTAFFGSEYNNGKRIKRCLEEDILYLQALCTSAKPEPSPLFKMINDLLELKSGVNAEEKEQFDLIKALVGLHCASSNQKQHHFRTIKNILQDKKYAASGHQDKILKFEIQMNEENEIREFIILVIELLGELVWIHADARMIITILNLLIHWTWGTTNNIIYNPSGVLPVLLPPGIIPNDSYTKTRNYVDEKMLSFLPHLSLLRKERKVDIIFYLDYSGGNSIENVKKTAELCKGMNIPFPEVPTDGSGLKDFYVLKGNPDAPVVINIPLFESEGEIKEWKEKIFSIKTPKYRDMITTLKEKAVSKVSKNKTNLLNEIKDIVNKKRNNM